MAGSPSRAFPRGGVLSRVSVLETASVSRSLPRMCDHVDAHVLTHTRAHMQTCVPTQTRTAAHRHASHTRTHAHPSFSEVHSSSVWLFLSHGQGLRHTRVRAHTRTQIRNPEVSVFLVRAHGPGHPDLCYQPRRNTGHPPRVGFLEGSLTALLEASERSCYKPWGLSGCSLTSRPAGLLVRAACADPPPYPLLPTPLGLSLQRLQSPHFVSLPLFCPSPNLGMSPWGAELCLLGWNGLECGHWCPVWGRGKPKAGTRGLAGAQALCRTGGSAARAAPWGRRHPSPS